MAALIQAILHRLWFQFSCADSVVSIYTNEGKVGGEIPPISRVMTTKKEMLMEKVKDIYKELLRKDFSGTYKGPFTKYDKEWEMIQVDPDDPIMGALGNVKDQVQDKVWKGFTGTEDGYKFTDYCLYVEVVGSPEKERFRILNVKPFPVTNVQDYSWNLGVRMTVKGIA